MLEESLQYETGSFILGNEFLLMEALNYSLTVYNSYRPLDGFLIELKDRLSSESSECLKKHALSFINDAILTDATLLYSPSQIALSALVYRYAFFMKHLNSRIYIKMFSGHPCSPDLILSNL